MAMTAAQETEFIAASGMTSSGTMSLSIASIFMVLLFLWAAYVVFTHFVAWHHGEASFYALTSSLVRSAVILLLLGFFIR